MKSLTDFMNESLAQENHVNESNWGSDEYKEAAKKIEEHIDELQDQISAILGVKVKLNISAGPRKIEIESDNLLPQLKDKMWYCLYKEITFATWGGSYNEKDNTIWFNPKLFWQHATGGSNGHDIAGLSNIWFKLDTNEWEIK